MIKNMAALDSASTADAVPAAPALDCASTADAVPAAPATEVEIPAPTPEHAAWLVAHWLPAATRRPPAPCESVDVDAVAAVVRVRTDEAAAAAWTRAVAKALKGVESEDLGAMDAPRLQETFTADGAAALARHEHALRVTVVFRDDGRVLLVGPKAKLAKKCSDVRSLLSHFHWRLSGRDVCFAAATS
jgi:hypothetical protein